MVYSPNLSYSPSDCRRKKPPKEQKKRPKFLRLVGKTLSSRFSTISKRSSNPVSNRFIITHRLKIYGSIVISFLFTKYLSGVPSSSNKFEEARRKREERKLARQQQMEAKRAAKLRTGVPAKKV